MAGTRVFDAGDLRRIFSYDSATGKLTRVVAEGSGRSAMLGVELGYPYGDGHLSATWRGRTYRTARLVWAWHNGTLPANLRHINGDTTDDRIENLEPLKKRLSISYASDGEEVNEFGTLPEGFGGGIYEILCVRNGRKYIGSAIDMQKRWRQHYTGLNNGTHHSQHLQRAWSKHGESSFVFQVIERCESADLICREQHYIDTLNPEFNSNPIAGSMLGFRHSEESKRKMAASRPSGFSSFAGRRHTEETKRRISKKKSGVRQSHEAVRKRADSIRKLMGKHCAKKFSEEQIREIRLLSGTGIKNIEIANRFGVSDGVISEIKNRKTYRWVA